MCNARKRVTTTEHKLCVLGSACVCTALHRVLKRSITQKKNLRNKENWNISCAYQRLLFARFVPFCFVCLVSIMEMNDIRKTIKYWVDWNCSFFLFVCVCMCLGALCTCLVPMCMKQEQNLLFFFFCWVKDSFHGA